MRHPLRARRAARPVAAARFWRRLERRPTMTVSY
jgi:hypothetical protein